MQNSDTLPSDHKPLAEKIHTEQGQHLRGIDSLRALAVWVVIVYHLEADFLPGGFVGVDIFFAISGFVITKSLMEREQKSLTSFFTGFYRRRFIRIAPALFVYLIMMVTLVQYFIPKTFLSSGIYDTARWAVFGASNIQLVQSNDGYFGERMDYSPFIQTWSLGVEEQFYIFWPLLIALFVFAGAKAQKISQRLTIVLIAILTGASVFISARDGQEQPINAFYLLPSRFWELAAGGLLYLAISRYRNHDVSLNWHRALFIIGISLITITLIFADVQQFPFWWAIPPVLGTLLLIFTSVNAARITTNGSPTLLTARPTIYFGNISYSLYLWHWGVFVLMRWTVGLSTWWHWIIALAATIGISAASYKFIETPVRTAKIFKKMPDWKIIISGILMALATIVIIDASRSAWNDKASAGRDPAFVNSKAIKEKLATIKKSKIGESRQIVFVGDSHAGHYKHMGQWIQQKTKAEFSRLINYGCPYVDLAAAAAVTRPDVCPSEDEITRELIDRVKPGDVVVLSSFSNPRMAGHDSPYDEAGLLENLNSEDSQKGRQEAFASSKKIVEELQAKGLNVVLAAPTPVFVTAADRCRDWFNKVNLICQNGFKEEIDYQMKLRDPVMISYQRLSDETGAVLWDPFPYLCPDDFCYSEKNGDYLFIDQHHLTANGNLLLLDSMMALLQDVWR